MRTAIKVALGAAMLAGTALTAAPADARVAIGVGIGVPGPYYGDPCYGPNPYPEYCGYPVYSGPVFWGGAWHTGNYYYRFVNGHRVFWNGGGWHNDWHARGERGWHEGGHHWHH